MRRTLLALVGFSVAVTVLVGLKSASTARVLGWSAESELVNDDIGTDAGSGDVPGEPGASGSASVPTGTPGAVSTSASPAGPGATTVPTAGSSSPAPSKSSSTLPSVSGTFTGAAVAVRTAQSPTTKSSRCGDCADYTIAVTITVANGRVTATSVAYQPSPGESQSYASSANSKLSKAMLNAQTQTWKLGRVSGATYSGNAWELSVKDAMTKAGLPV